jgi:hypothetical protein
MAGFVSSGMAKKKIARTNRQHLGIGTPPEITAAVIESSFE